MNIIGLNLEKTSYGLSLDNGGSCLVKNGQVVSMINEERLNRIQYSSGYKESLEYVLKEGNVSIKDIDIFSVSSCLEIHRSVKSIQAELKRNGFNIPRKKIKVCDHHLSHAYSAFYPSQFRKAIVMVLDGDGNALSNKNKKEYWKNKFDHQSYYIGEGDSLNLLERDVMGIGENGIGGAYRYFTYFCGFPGYKYAGKLMGLSAYGSKRIDFKGLQLFRLLKNGKIKCNLPDSDRLNSSVVVEEWFRSNGIKIKARKPGDKISKDIKDIAWFVQEEMNRILVEKVNYLVKKTGIKNICIAGGVGLNAVTNNEILDKTSIERIFIQPAAGDSGQCLGNAYWAMCKFDKKNLKKNRVSVYQGRKYTNKEILETLQYMDDSISYKKMKFKDVATLAAEKVSQGFVIGWFQGRSEIGPRALGNRSIIANPIRKNTKMIINNKVKNREGFRPFAPSVLTGDSSNWFDIRGNAPYMIMNAMVRYPNKIPAVTHVDGSARLQTVSRRDNYKYHRLISEFKKRTGVPVVLNTSLNENEAIVETPRDAINLFLRTSIDFIFIGDYFVEKKQRISSRKLRMKNIENRWSKVASQTNKIQNAKNKVMNKTMLSLIRKHVNNEGQIFDYNAEWGEYMKFLTSNGFYSQGLNSSDKMARTAKKRCKGSILYTQEEFYKKMHTLENKFDAVISNLWLCITKKEEHDTFLSNLKILVKDDGVIIISFCHPSFDYMKESIVTHRVIPKSGIKYNQEFKYTKIIHENGLEFEDYHRPLSYYTSLFRKNNFKILNIAESDVLDTNFYPDFIFFVLKKVKKK